MLRLGLFQMGLGMMSVLFLGVLNRAMINSLEIPATIAASMIAMHQFVAPARVWFGQLSDTRPILGHHRSGYVWIGSLLLGSCAFGVVQLMWGLGSVVQELGSWLWHPTVIFNVLLLGSGFALYGLMLSASSTPFAALLVDVSDEEDRSRLVGTVWSMLMVGIVVGAIIISRLLKQLTADTPISELQAGINQVFIVVPIIVFGLSLLATIGIEPRYSRYGQRSIVTNREDQITLGQALKVLTASPQTGTFFTFLSVMTISLFMQDAILEPYGDAVFQMSFKDTTLLNAYYGSGTLFGIGLTGFLLTPRIGKENTAKVGCLSVAFVVGLIILTGFTKNAQLLKIMVGCFGLASGVTTTGAISLMLDLTAAETAGTFIGAWGLAQAWARAMATVVGGGLLNLGQTLFTRSVEAYALVFTVQALGMIFAIWMLQKVNIQEFQQDTRRILDAVLEADLD
jgi:BCD family chlorophyll transporter-like MFS transporter